MKVTINDVAERAGVSIKTVSRVINNEPSVRASTRQKVLDAVTTLNYSPNLAARNLAGTHSYSVAFIYDNPNAYYVIDMQNGILEACRAHGYELLIHPSDSKSSLISDDLCRLVDHGKVAGLVLTPPFSETPSIIETLKSRNVEFVRIVSSHSTEAIEENCIQIDDYQAAYDITQYLLALGHRRIAYLSGGEEHLSTLGRLQGYCKALEEAGIAIDRQLIIKGEYSFESGEASAKEILHSDTPPTALFAGNDEIAAGALFAARLLNIDVPGKLSIVGFEDSPFSRQTWPKLTTAHQPNQEIARSAAELALSRIRCKGAQSCHGNGLESSDKIHRSFTPQLVIRESTGPAP
ncbi:LacI family DNA-binding transcriptional regulator [Microbulbifer sp. OS29]|uniref:LacI family DNA-binding transcriptional regulator n=1 Tax=Microbulbifer okhotskensis TaxID=2926617 RepID=A0A9X2ELH6_9GAMM|nr:LacI family DNA-binding transcriptional regulator [Microbulbifer okhotskensis]MCO1333881.1 LacI family DNA-binding transcriptional regulator [Microbulbifer okhotskensis]